MPRVDDPRPRCITPPRLLEHLLRNKDGDVRRAAMRTLLSTARLRGERTTRASFAAVAAPANGRRTVRNVVAGS